VKIDIAGDLGNVQADEQGKAHYEITVTNVSIMGPEKSDHRSRGHRSRQVDDGSQPVGNAGSRIACGVIGVANSK